MDWKAEKEKLHQMSLGKKVGYLVTYYRWMALLLVAMVLLVIYLGDIAYRSSKTFVLQGFIANDEQQLFDEKALTSGFSSYLGLGAKEIVVLDDSLYVQLGKADHYIEASMAKIYAYMAAKELDFLIGPEFVVDHYLSALVMRDFTHLFTNDKQALSKLLEPHLHASLSSEGMEGFYKLDLGFSRYAGDIPLFMIIPKGSPNPERVLEFLTYISR
ncbi:MAG: hypothetical protein EOM68_07360 [Spirochaetia bacterium]|nr:hypothetical protein [Spirochaetia bacterium]